MKKNKSLPVFPLYTLYTETTKEPYVCYPVTKLIALVAFSLFLGLPLL
jgi:hypothetical protein